MNEHELVPELTLIEVKPEHNEQQEIDEAILRELITKADLILQKIKERKGK
jgi:hypothetical protein